MRDHKNPYWAYVSNLGAVGHWTNNAPLSPHMGLQAVPDPGKDMTTFGPAPSPVWETPFQQIPPGIQFPLNTGNSSGDGLQAGTVPAHASWHSSASITLNCWVYLRALPIAQACFSARGNNIAAFSARAWAFFVTSAGALQIDIFVGGARKQGFSNNGIVSAGRWHMVTVTHVSGTQSYYVDGQFDSSDALVGAMNTTGGALQARQVDIAYLMNNTTPIFCVPGAVASLSHFNYVLTAQQVHKLYALGVAPIPSTQRRVGDLS